MLSKEYNRTSTATLPHLNHRRNRSIPDHSNIVSIPSMSLFENDAQLTTIFHKFSLGPSIISDQLVLATGLDQMFSIAQSIPVAQSTFNSQCKAQLVSKSKKTMVPEIKRPSFVHLLTLKPLIGRKLCQINKRNQSLFKPFKSQLLLLQK